MAKKRFFGILMPISALPSPYGIGTLGKEAFRFVDFLKEAGAKVWQILPLTLPSYGNSPYQSPSGTGFNYYLIDLDLLVKEGILKKEEIEDQRLISDPHRVDYESLFNSRIATLRLAFSRFGSEDKEFKRFLKKGEYRDFAFFMSLKLLNGFRPFYEWEEDKRRYSSKNEDQVIKENFSLYSFFVWTQFVFLKQYDALRAYAHKKGIKIMGDMPIYLAYDSVEVYKYPECFLLDDDGRPKVVAGVPPDAFSEDGQLWGNPIYDWDFLEKNDYVFFNERIKRSLQVYDILRIDHFRAFSAYYEIPYGAANAREGCWRKGPGFSLFKDKLDLPIVAENLGIIDDDLLSLMEKCKYPGMAVSLFAINNLSKEDLNKPWNVSQNTIAYTGTHDNQTILGTLSSLNEDEMNIYRSVIKECCGYLALRYSGQNIYSLAKTIINLTLAYPCFGVIIPLQDLLMVGAEGRMNEPSTLSPNNWSYRFLRKDFSFSKAKRIAKLVKKFRR